MLVLVKSFTISLGAGAMGLLYFLTKKQSLPTPVGPAYKVLPKLPYADHPNKHFISKVPEKIGVIGAGAAGICAAKELKSQGYQVEVLEKGSQVGGVWVENYDDAALQGAFIHYNFPDFKFPEGVETFPKLPVVLKFLQDYSDHFGVTPLIRFNTEVAKVHQKPNSTWALHLKDGSVRDYDFLVLANGLFNTPLRPIFKGQENFKGKIFHSSEMRKMDVLTGKKVVVIGGGKSGSDLARAAVENNAESSIHSIKDSLNVFLSGEKFALGIPTIAWISNRVTQCFIPPHDNKEKGLIYNYLKFLHPLFHKFIAKSQKGIPEELRVNRNMGKSLGINVIGKDPSYLDFIKEGKIQVLKGAIDELTENSITINGKAYETDIIICATGFERYYFGLNKDGADPWLYRTVILPEVKNFAMIGLFATFFTNTYNTLSSIWLAEMLRGAVKLPSVEEMKKDTEIRKERLTRAWGENSKLSYFYSVSAPLADRLLKDMGIPHRRKATVKEEWLGMLFPEDYRTVVTHRV